MTRKRIPTEETSAGAVVAGGSLHFGLALGIVGYLSGPT